MMVQILILKASLKGKACGKLEVGQQGRPKLQISREALRFDFSGETAFAFLKVTGKLKREESG